MAKLSREQIDFLAKHEIPNSKVLDATGLTAKVWKQRLKALDLWFAYGVAPSAAKGHQMRASNSTCIQCNTHQIKYSRRYVESGEVYVAWSRSCQIVKVGVAGDAFTRIDELNIYQYGGPRDWELRFSQWCDGAGQIEFEVHRNLAPKTYNGTYLKNGRAIECRELFKCSASTAIKAVQRAIQTQSE